MYAAYLQDSAGHKVALREGVNEIGRESNFLKDCLGKAYAEDLRISRKHAEIVFSKQTGSLIIYSRGTNPLKYFAAEPNTQAELILRDKSRPLRDGDSIQLLDGVYTLKVVVVKEAPQDPITVADPEPLEEIIPLIAPQYNNFNQIQDQKSPKEGKNPPK
jgi:hypothetical protein